ncbi:hypothetical protein JD844_028043 [Phrynosoma platyrhinos]|uniref:Protein-tyrosine-phosphatase n=1 Tax=Phrynosoma platyrhinos TaxID=52577 RepID=A0ABQ7SHK3_PHRPL|nr:hypothetical protein JD844_028043 [Phrynosoma platyrhinos]
MQMLHWESGWSQERPDYSVQTPHVPAGSLGAQVGPKNLQEPREVRPKVKQGSGEAGSHGKKGKAWQHKTWQPKQRVPDGPIEQLAYQNVSSTAVNISWMPPIQPNGVVFYNVSLEIQDAQGDAEILSFISYDTNVVINRLEKYTSYLLNITPATEKGPSEMHTTSLYIRTEEDVPDSAPVMKSYKNLSSTSVMLSWDPPVQPNGIIISYDLKLQGPERNESFATSNNSIILEDLSPFTLYTFFASARTIKGLGPCAVLMFSTDESDIVQNIHCTATSWQLILVQWDPPLKTNGIITHYIIMFGKNSTIISSTNETVHTFRDLLSNTSYQFKIKAATAAGEGEEQTCNASTFPEKAPDAPPENVTVVVTSPYSINISWNEPLILTGPTFYLIDITSVDTDDYKASFVKTNDEERTLAISGLRAFTRYSVVVTADPLNNVTFQKIPNEVTKFQVTFIPPSELSGNIQVYQAMVYKEDDPTIFQIYNLTVIDRTNKSVTALIEGLKGGYTYNISVYALNGAGAGPKIQLKITTDMKEPPRPSKKPMPVYDTSGILLVTSTTITVHMPVCYYSDDHGPIKKIQILVAEVGVQHDGNVTKWYDAYFKKPRPYFVNEGFPNPPCVEGNEGLTSKEDVYVIGADSTCTIPGSEEKICNGPLKPRKQYLFKFRATNIKGQFTDSDYSDPIKTLGDGLSERAVEIILAVTLCILSIILLVAAIYAFARIRQKQKEGGTYSPRDAEIIDTKFKLDQLITVADLEMKDERFTRRKEIFVIQLLSYRKSIKPIGKKCFLQHVEELCANNNLKFQEEFSELPKFLPDLASTDADLPWNRSKNRFPNIKPYNNNRVKLMPDASIPGSDYINASYVSGYLCPNEFIATQGPLPGTVGDFWRMVWETRAKTLVMLSQCFEKGRIRCHQYWPEDNIPVTVFGDIVITKLVEDIQIDWTIRDLKIERHGDCMMVRQCNFTAWPEHGVPEASASLVHFVKLIRASRAHDSTPIVVHCSAGVGRTGVYIALDHLTQHINDHDFVDIYGLVAELRSERMCMVQNLAQYIFLHQCILDLLTIKRSSQPVCFVNYSVLQKMDSLDAMEGDVELEWEETTM